MGVTATPTALADGTIHRLSEAQRFCRGLFDETNSNLGVDLVQFEADLDMDRVLMEADARRALRDDGVDSARQVLTEGCLRLTRRVE